MEKDAKNKIELNYLQLLKKDLKHIKLWELKTSALERAKLNNYKDTKGTEEYIALMSNMKEWEEYIDNKQKQLTLF